MRESKGAFRIKLKGCGRGSLVVVRHAALAFSAGVTGVGLDLLQISRSAGVICARILNLIWITFRMTPTRKLSRSGDRGETGRVRLVHHRIRSGLRNTG